MERVVVVVSLQTFIRIEPGSNTVFEKRSLRFFITWGSFIANKTIPTQLSTLHLYSPT
jgi:hypothetical protein